MSSGTSFSEASEAFVPPAYLKWLGYGSLLALGILGPIVFPAYTIQISVLWLMVVFALTWDMLGGQMGYNSLGNIFFFGIGMYTCAIIQIGLYFDVGEYTDPAGALRIGFSPEQYFTGLTLGLLASGFAAALLAIVFGWIVFGLRGPYFAIGTLGVAIAAAELITTWDWVGGGSGISLPTFPGTNPDTGKQVFYVLNFLLAVAVFVFLKWLYSTRFGLAINAIRDDEEKAEAMGIHTNRYKTMAWSLSAFFLGISGAIFGNMVSFIEPREVAFPTVTFGVFMVLMVLLGGKGTIWGPIVGAIVFHVIKEVTWTYFLGWQFVALGALIIVIVVFFQQGIVGWLMEARPEWFGIKVEKKKQAASRRRAAA
ncbi:MAG: branched-chain amino acid ABC transporter permease [Hyphomicrobiales bacterium]